MNQLKFISIGVNKYTDESINYLTDKLNSLNQKKINIKTTLVKSPTSCVIVCDLAENRIISAFTDRNFSILKYYVSVILSDYIIKYYEEKLLSRIININYCYFNSLEKEQILNICASFLATEKQNSKINLNISKRKNIVFRSLIKYFHSSNEIILDGFINFRIKEYFKELEDIVDKAVDAFLMEREYQEFIKLLRYFVDIQEPKLEAVHILATYDNKYIILDHFHNEITNECIKEFLNEVSESDINYDDLLVSSLITIAPIRIYIHDEEQIKNKELIKTIKNVFINKVIVCSGCSLCKINRVRSTGLIK